MSDMIKRDDVLAIIADLKKEYPTHSVPDAEAKVALRKVADKIRAIDAVEVVRCKECKHAHMTYEGLCKHCDAWKDDDGICLELYVSGDYYCADGERKESE